MTIIGDVHGYVDEYHEIIKNHLKTIQIGDFGFQIEYDQIKPENYENHKILFGNHDFYPYINKEYSCGDWKFFDEYKLMTIRGATSIDKNNRLEGWDYFREEEMNYLQQRKCLLEYKRYKPDIVISHDCPSSIRNKLFPFLDEYTSTQKLLNECLYSHKPKLWIFGHYHRSIKIKIEDTNFICLNELETYTLK